MTDLSHSTHSQARSETLIRALRVFADWLDRKLGVDRPATARARPARRRDRDVVVSPLEEFH
jgi:hypothetical protein